MSEKKKERLAKLAEYVGALYPGRKEPIDYVDIVISMTNDLEAIKKMQGGIDRRQDTPNPQPHALAQAEY